jgi:hypothetical protein
MMTGVATFLDEESARSPGQPALLGTDRGIAIELLKSPCHACRSTDLFSLGLEMVRLFAGNLLTADEAGRGWASADMDGRLKLKQEQMRRALEQLPKFLNEDGIALFTAMLQEDPEHRKLSIGGVSVPLVPSVALRYAEEKQWNFVLRGGCALPAGPLLLRDLSPMWFCQVPGLWFVRPFVGRALLEALNRERERARKILASPAAMLRLVDEAGL